MVMDVLLAYIKVRVTLFVNSHFRITCDTTLILPTKSNNGYECLLRSGPGQKSEVFYPNQNTKLHLLTRAVRPSDHSWQKLCCAYYESA